MTEPLVNWKQACHQLIAMLAIGAEPSTAATVVPKSPPQHTALREAVRAHAEPSPAATLMTSVRAGMAVCPEFRPAGKLLHATTEPLLSSAVE